MEIVSVWLIHHKASLDPYSPMNMDGSKFMVGIGVVPAVDMKSALELFEKYLQTQQTDQQFLIKIIKNTEESGTKIQKIILLLISL